MMDSPTTRQRILEVARELFNAHGLNRVGVREIARAAEISPGNLSYHFATKDALVAALYLELRDLNARTIFAKLPDPFTLVSLYEAACVALRHMLLYRFLLLSRVDAIAASPELQALESELRAGRHARDVMMIDRLVASGCIDRRKFNRAPWLFEIGAMISTYWLADATTRLDIPDDESAVAHYAGLGIALLEPYCTDKGRRQVRKILAR